MVRKFGAAAGSPSGVAPLLGRRPGGNHQPHDVEQHEGKAPRTARFSLKVRRRFHPNHNNGPNKHNSSKTTPQRMIPFIESRGGSDNEEEDADYEDDPCSTLTPTYADSFAGRRRGHAQVVATSGMDIWTACIEGDVPYVSATVQRFPEFIHLEQRGRTPLYHACENNHVAIVAMLLEAGATDWDGSCAQAATAPVIKNLLLQYKVVDQELQMRESRSSSSRNSRNSRHNNNGNCKATSSREDITKNLLPADTGLTAWEVCSLPESGGHGDAFSFCGGEDVQSHFSSPIEHVLHPADGTGDLREERTPDDAEPEAEVTAVAINKEVSDKDFVSVQGSQNNDSNKSNSKEEAQVSMTSGVEQTALNFGKVRQQFETVITEKKKPKRRWLPKKLLSKKKDSVDIVETESLSLESRSVIASARGSDNKNEPEHLEPQFLKKLFPSDPENKDEDLVEEKPFANVAAPLAASVAATTIGTSTVTSAAVDSAAAAGFAWSDQEIVRIEAVHKNSRWLALKHKMTPTFTSNNTKNNFKATHLEVEQGQLEADPPRWATEFVTSDRSSTPVNEGAEILQTEDEVKSVSSTQAKSSSNSIAGADSNRPMDSVDFLGDLGNIASGWFTLPKAKLHADAATAAAEQDAGSIAKHSISNVTDGGVEVRDKRTHTLVAKTMTISEDGMASTIASGPSTSLNDIPTDVSVASELGSSKDLTVSSRVSKKSLASKAASIASKASKLTLRSKEARMSEIDSTAVATSGSEGNDKALNEDEVASSKTWPGVEVAPKGDGSTKTWSPATIPSLMPKGNEDNVDHPCYTNKNKKSVKSAISKVFSSVKGSANRSVAVKEAALQESHEKSETQSDDRSVQSAPSVRSNTSKRSWTTKQLFTDPFEDESDDESSSASNSGDKAVDVASASPSEAKSSTSIADVVAAAGAAVLVIKDEGLDEEASADTQDTQSESEGGMDELETEEDEEVEVTLEDFGVYSLGHHLEDHGNDYDEDICLSAAIGSNDMSNPVAEHADGDIKEQSDVTVAYISISPLEPIIRNKQPVEDGDDEAVGLQQPRVDSQLSRFAQSFSTAADDRSAGEQDILDTPSVEETLESEESPSTSTSQTPQGQEGNEDESISSGGEDLSNNEDTDDEEESDDDLGSVGSKTHASDATGFQLMGTASGILVHPSDTFRAISEEISCILRNH